MSKPNIAKFGVWTNIYAYSYAGQIELAQQAEAHGYGAIWIPDMVSKDPFVSLALMANETDKIYLATGIENIYSRIPMAMAGARSSIGELSNGRLILGLGVSHTEMVSNVLNLDYTKPVSTMRDYLNAMKPAEIPGVNTSEAEDDQSKYGIVILAALRDKMMALAGEMTDGAHPYLITPEHTAHAREILGPDSFLAPEQKVVLEKDATKARAVARQHLAVYLGLGNYRNSLFALGFNENDCEEGGSDRLVDGLVAWGDEEKVLKHLEAHLNNGADHVAIQALRPDGEQGFDNNVLKAFAIN